MDQKICNSTISLKNVQQDGLFMGYASVFNVLDRQNDVILPGSFIGTLERDIKLLWQHNQSEPIGKILKIFENDKGLYITAQLLLDLHKGKEAYVMLKSGTINALSIGYHPLDYDVDDYTNVRTIKKIELWEISLVTFPANEDAQVVAVKDVTAQDMSQETKLINALTRAEQALNIHWTCCTSKN